MNQAIEPPNTKANQDNLVIIGKISGVFGVKGWVKIESYTRPADNICLYNQFYVNGGNKNINQELIKVHNLKAHAKGFVAEIEGLNCRDEAKHWTHATLSISRDMLNESNSEDEENDSEHYWVDLIGLEVFNQENEYLGIIDSLFETGANDVMVVKAKDSKEHLIPYVPTVIIKDINYETQRMVCDWSLSDVV